MQLHIPTLAMVAVFVTAILGALLLLASRRDRSSLALVWWGIGYILGGMSFALLALRGLIPDVVSIEIANALLLLCYSFILAGARAFGGRQTPVTVFLIAPLIWLTAMTVPSIAANIEARVVVVSSLQVTIVALVAFEFWRGRAEPLLSRWPAIFLLAFHMVTLTLRMIVAQVTPIMMPEDLFRSPAFAVMAFGSVLYTITLAFVLLSMSKERSELRHKIAALVDPLTGLANRRSFMLDAENAIARRASRSEPFAVLLADLDHFKTVNDAFGHAVGDKVLTVFADVLERSVAPLDLVGRIGGEEFALLLPGKTEAEAAAIAERMRVAFADAALELDGHAVSATVSFGVAASGVGDLTGLLARADRALYAAKEQGRNRVASFSDSMADEVPAKQLATVVPIRPRAVA
jgi:diguanylate cyclase (GGDEF)-like protein